jgi:hypothetical protein
MAIFRRWSEQERENMIAEAFDPNKVTLICKKHMYAGQGLPTHECKNCSQVWWMNWAAKLPAHKRTEIIEEVHRLVKMAIELEEKGQFDVKLNKHPEITIEPGEEN